MNNNLKFNDYYNKVLGCFVGKNIGGTLGAPFECYRGVYNVKFYMQDVSSPVPNDDVDLQLVWLRAVENVGHKLDTFTLAEYWNTYISSTVSEYGTGKNNFSAGILPPLCGRLRNINKDSNGAWIRTEIWACLCAANPELAALYAYYDASFDHSDEGVYAAVFVAVLQSCAFIETNIKKLIKIALSYVPEDCCVAKAALLALSEYEKKTDFFDLRKKMFLLAPTGFGLMGGYWKGTPEVPASPECPVQTKEPDVPDGIAGYDAPWHIGMIMAALLYGEDDFEKTVCLAVNCGEDTDCTAGTAASIWGILHGEKSIPEKWKKGCSEKIAMISLRYDQYLCPPKTVGELAYRVAKQAPEMLGAYHCDLLPEFFKKDADENFAGGYFEIIPQADLYCGKTLIDKARINSVSELMAEHKNTVRKRFDLYEVAVEYDSSFVKISEGAEKTLKLKFYNLLFTPQYLTVRLLGVPEGWVVKGGAEFCAGLEHWHGSTNSNDRLLTIIPGSVNKASVTVVMEISSLGRGTKNYLPLTFINGSCIELDKNN